MQKRIKKHRKRIITIFALAAITMVVIGLPAKAQDNEKSVREVLSQSATGFEKGDMAALERLWATDESLTVFESGHANYGWADYRDHHLGPEMKEMKNTKYTLSDIKVKVSGNTAWATFKYTISADIGTRHVDGAGLGTAVLEKRGQDWRIVHWHSSAPRRTPAAAPSPSPAAKP
ncbi:MAG: nuclear transport factor 2 family protein [Pyrinomonadaceae bacterium]